MSRHREILTSKDPLEAEYTYKKYVGTWEDPINVANNASSGSVPYFNTYMSDVVTPDFHSRVARGEIINSPMAQFTEEVIPNTISAFSYRKINRDPDGGIFGEESVGEAIESEAALGPYLDIPSEVEAATASLIAQAVTSAHANASSSKIMGLATVGEGKKTIASVGAILWRVIKIAKAVRHADYRYLQHQISRKELENRYMELRYAIRPLMYDVKNVMAALDTSRLQRDSRRTFRGFKKGSWADSDTLEIVTWKTYTVKRDITVDLEVRSGVLCDVKMTDAAIFGLDQVLETALELTPWSFVFNWFFNIADTLAAWAPSMGIHELASWSVANTRISRTNSLVDSTITAPWVSPGTGWSNLAYEYQKRGTKQWNSTSKIRAVNPDLSIIPAGRLSFDVLKLTDLAIMLTRLK